MNELVDKMFRVGFSLTILSVGLALTTYYIVNEQIEKKKYMKFCEQMWEIESVK